MPHAFVTLLILIVLLPLLGTLAWNLWLSYIQTEFTRKLKWVLLEIKPPKDVFKSPLAMELVLNALYQGGGVGTWYHRYWLGNLRQYFSLEIVSTEGAIHFYIRTPDRFRKLIESQIYAQYPQAEVMEVEDYTNRVPAFTKDAPIGVWGANMVLTKDDAYPIKTYVDFGLDRAVGTLAEEERIDPITPTLEFMGSIGAGENIWMQILVRADTPRFNAFDKKKGAVSPNMKWTDAANDIIKSLQTETDKEGKTVPKRPTKNEQSIIDALERNKNKFGFDVGIRLMYVTAKDKFDANRIAAILGMLRQYNTVDFNGFKPDGPTITGGHDYPWQDVFGTKTFIAKRDTLGAYKARAFFYGGFDIKNPVTYFTHPNASGMKPFILTTEELATLFHLPGRVAETPTFERIESKKAEAPVNLPI